MTDALGVNAEHVESLAFAWLAMQVMQRAARQSARRHRARGPRVLGRHLLTREIEKGAASALGYAAIAGSRPRNDDPQPQVLVAFGFLITNCAPSTPSW